ncbi:MAG: hypothetical protein V4632_00905 [Pseudomonadota bacterium]
MMAIFAIFAMVTSVAGWFIAERVLQGRHGKFWQGHSVEFESAHVMTWTNGVSLNITDVLVPFFVFLLAIAIAVNALHAVFTPFPHKHEPGHTRSALAFRQVSGSWLIKKRIKIFLMALAVYLVTTGLSSGLLQKLQASPPVHPLVSIEGAALIFTLGCVLAFIAVLNKVKCGAVSANHQSFNHFNEIIRDKKMFRKTGKRISSGAQPRAQLVRHRVFAVCVSDRELYKSNEVVVDKYVDSRLIGTGEVSGS